MNLTLFDLDGTLLPGDSDHAFGEFVVRLGWADAQTFKSRNDAFYVDYLAGCLDIHAYMDFATAPWRDREPAALRQAAATFLQEVVQPMLKPAATDLVAKHQAQGDLMAVVTATNDFVTRPIAALLGVPTLIATDLARDDSGRVTGAIQGVPCFREGKIQKVKSWLAARSQTLADFERCTFYSDSTNDLPLLEHVSHPVATNPGPALERIAQERGWPILKLFS
ncbi:MAG: HAD family hydrolase [Rubrivivax sp.]|jgi:HAD superfamily hydrolase (TIGR01490 family)|nr:HAD family hydrolase [Rubrivivax sp.]